MPNTTTNNGADQNIQSLVSAGFSREEYSCFFAIAENTRCKLFNQIKPFMEQVRTANKVLEANTFGRLDASVYKQYKEGALRRIEALYKNGHLPNTPSAFLTMFSNYEQAKKRVNNNQPYLRTDCVFSFSRHIGFDKLGTIYSSFR